MKVSAKAEYACIAMMELAVNYGDSHPLRIKAIADAHPGMSDRFLVQVLLLLKGKGLVTSVRGASGGYQLARPAESISLADILNAAEGEPSVRSALAESESSPSTAARTLLDIWKEVQAEEQRFLHNITLADVVRRARESTVDMTYQI
jgi:Rrf2 family protein